MITGAQIREARMLLKWALWRVAKALKLSVRTVAKIEGADGVPDISAARLLSIRDLFEAAGVEFLYGDQPGVRLREMSES